jgi:hypothetical protein
MVPRCSGTSEQEYYLTVWLYGAYLQCTTSSKPNKTLHTFCFASRLVYFPSHFKDGYFKCGFCFGDHKFSLVSALGSKEKPQTGSDLLLLCQQLQVTVLDKSHFQLVWFNMYHITASIYFMISQSFYFALNHTPMLLIHRFIEGWHSILDSFISYVLITIFPSSCKTVHTVSSVFFHIINL